MEKELIINRLAAEVYKAYTECFDIEGASDYDKLPPEEQERNRSAANHIPKLLSRVGLSLIPDHADWRETPLTEDIIEKLAELEHNRWLKEKVALGMHYGVKPQENENPNMLFWTEVSREKLKELPARLVAAVGEENLLGKPLDEKIKQNNRCFIRRILEHVKDVGFKIVKLQ